MVITAGLGLAGRGIVKDTYTHNPTYLGVGRGSARQKEMGLGKKGRVNLTSQKGGSFLSFVVFILTQGRTRHVRGLSFLLVCLSCADYYIASSKIRFIANKNENNAALTSFQENKKE